MWHNIYVDEKGGFAILRSIEEIYSMVEGIGINVTSPELIVKGVSIDSRTLIEGDLFVPIVRIDDGHNYVKQAFENGAVVSLWQADHVPPPEGLPLIIVEDTLKALHELAQSYRGQLNCKVIGVTGSNGKTTVKDLISSLLSASYKVHKTIGNLNGEYGLPLTLLAVEEDTDIIVLEMGMSNAGEMKILSEIAKPDIGIITMIGVSHLASLGSREGIASAKLEILEGLNPCGVFIINGDEPLLNKPLSEMRLPETLKVIRFGESPGNDYYPLEINLNESSLSFTMNKYQAEFSVPMLGRHNVLNVLAAMAVADCFQIKQPDIQSGLEKLVMTGMRMERIVTPRGFMIINDAWNASPVSMKAAIETLSNLEGFNRRILILGDMLELGDKEIEFHAKIAKCIDMSKIQTVFTIGNLSKIISDTLHRTRTTGEVKHFTSKAELTAACKPLLNHNDVVLIKGSRGLKLEEICDSLNK